MARTITHITKEERSKIYKAKKIKNSAKVIVPKGKTHKSERIRLIENYLRKLGDAIYCPAMNANVAMIKGGRKETSFRAGARAKSTMAALNLYDAIQNAVYIKSLPIKKSSRGQKIYDRMHLLICPIQGVGYAKIVIGELKEYFWDAVGEKYAHYCITQVSLKELKQ